MLKQCVISSTHLKIGSQNKFKFRGLHNKWNKISSVSLYQLPRTSDLPVSGQRHHSGLTTSLRPRRRLWDDWGSTPVWLECFFQKSLENRQKSQKIPHFSNLWEIFPKLAFCCIYINKYFGQISKLKNKSLICVKWEKNQYFKLPNYKSFKYAYC